LNKLSYEVDIMQLSDILITPNHVMYSDVCGGPSFSISIIL